jgi:hypothetical protein
LDFFVIFFLRLSPPAAGMVVAIVSLVFIVAVGGVAVLGSGDGVVGAVVETDDAREGGRK